MSDSTINVGDRVSWRSTRDNSKGSRRRVGTVLRVYDSGGYAFIKPDKGQGRYQHLTLARLTKIAPQSAVQP